jgi:hypothetical protein
MTIKIKPNHCRLKSGEEFNGVPFLGEFTESDYIFELEIPHFITVQNGSAEAIVEELKVGDVFKMQYTSNEFEVTKIVESRKAKGTWGKREPLYVQFDYQKKEVT